MTKILGYIGLVLACIAGLGWVWTSGARAGVVIDDCTDASTVVQQLASRAKPVSPSTEKSYIVFAYPSIDVAQVVTFDSKGCVSGTTSISLSAYETWLATHPTGAPDVK